MRTGRGRGVLATSELVELELLEDEMTEAFLLRSASVGVVWSEDDSGDGEETSMLSMRGGMRRRGKRGETQDSREKRRGRRRRSQRRSRRVLKRNQNPLVHWMIYALYHLNAPHSCCSTTLNRTLWTFWRNWRSSTG